MKKGKINKRFILQKLDNKNVIFDIENGVIYTLNETASFIFNKLKLDWNSEQILNSLSRKYMIKKPKKIKDDVERIIKEVKALKFFQGNK